MADKDNENMIQEDQKQEDLDTSKKKNQKGKKTKEAEEREEIYIPVNPSAPGENGFFVSVNGKNYILPIGKKSLVPKAVAYEIRRSLEAQGRYYEVAAEKAYKE